MIKNIDKNKIVKAIVVVCIICIIICIVIIGAWVINVKMINISDDYATIETQNEEYEEVRYFGTIKTISCTVVFDALKSERVLQYLGYDTNTKCMFYVYYNPSSWYISTTPYTIQTEDGSVKQAVYGVDYK